MIKDPQDSIKSIFKAIAKAYDDADFDGRTVSIDLITELQDATDVIGDLSRQLQKARSYGTVQCCRANKLHAQAIDRFRANQEELRRSEEDRSESCSLQEKLPRVWSVATPAGEVVLRYENSEMKALIVFGDDEEEVLAVKEL